MPALGADIEDFLAKVLDARVLDKVRRICITEEIFNVATLVDLRDGNELKSIFPKGTALSICKGLPGLMLDVGDRACTFQKSHLSICFPPQLFLRL